MQKTGQLSLKRNESHSSPNSSSISFSEIDSATGAALAVFFLFIPDGNEGRKRLWVRAINEISEILKKKIIVTTITCQELTTCSSRGINSFENILCKLSAQAVHQLTEKGLTQRPACVYLSGRQAGTEFVGKSLTQRHRSL